MSVELDERGQSLDDDETEDEPSTEAEASSAITVRPIEIISEIIGTFMLVFIGTCTVASAVISGAQSGLWQIAVVWGIGLSLAIYATADLSGAHLNPAISFAFAILKPKDFPPWKMGIFWVSQLVGAIIAGLVNLALWKPALTLYETTNNITRGGPGSEKSAMILACYFPNPALRNTVGDIGWGHAFAVEMVGTAFLCMLIFALNDPGNTTVNKQSTPWLIGACLSMLLSIFAPMTMGGFNPVRDFGPRIVAAMFGWGSVAFPGPGNDVGFMCYLLAPLLGAPIGGLIATKILRLGYKVKVATSII